MTQSYFLKYEKISWKKGYKSIAGIDEAGRGSLAGPVVAAAVIFNKEYIIKSQNNIYSTLTDSKKLTEGKRDHFYKLLTNDDYVNIGVGIISSCEIDKINILNATHKAMIQALKCLHYDYILVDGLAVPGFSCDSKNIIKGDLLSLSISAASVIAKVTRDKIMKKESFNYPEYNFDEHKGYGTKKHIDALKKFGPTLIHRYSYKPISTILETIKK
ncbi:MAG: ribonuclease HII [Pontiellaceae bacterium]